MHPNMQVAAKMEYHGERSEDAEELTGEELCCWWSHTFIRPGSTLQVHPTNTCDFYAAVLLLAHNLHGQRETLYCKEHGSVSEDGQEVKRQEDM